MKNFLYFSPRVLSILFVLFVSIFAFDALEEKLWFLALLIHLIPSFVLIVAIVVAWKNEFIGAILFIAFGFVAVFSLRDFIASFPVIIPPFIIGILFLAQDIYFRKTFKK